MGWLRKLLPDSSAQRIVLFVALCILLAASADAALYDLSPHGLDPASFASHPLQPIGVVTSGTCGTAYKAANPVAAENTCPGTTAWQRQRVGGSVGAIEGFPAPDSLNIGETLRLYVSTSAPTYTIRIYRLGWYGGTGSHLLYTSPAIKGMAQPRPLYISATRTYSAANWTNPVSIHIPTTWVSGVCEAQFISYSGAINNTLFVVRNDASHAPIGVLMSLNTYQAYNYWGGHSLYGTPRGYMVTYDRPYDGPLGLGNFVYWDADAIRWMERQHDNVTYLADMDLDQYGSLAAQHKLMVVPGHSEYWSTGMRQALETSVSHGVSWAFLGSNNVYWHIRASVSPLGADRLITCYKDATLDPVAASEPYEATVRWRDVPVNNPEQAILGQMYAGIADGTSSLTLKSGLPALLANTGLTARTSLAGLVGGEYDQVWNTIPTPSAVVKLADSTVVCKPGQDVCDAAGHAESDATIYTANSGARVFDAGTFQWSWGLDSWGIGFGKHDHDYANAGFQKFNANLIAYLLHEPVPAASAA